MSLRIACLSIVACSVLYGTSEASVIAFRATRAADAWTCKDASQPDATREGLTINVLIDGATSSDKVSLKAKYQIEKAAKESDVPHSAKTLWSFVDKAANPDADSAVTVEGTIDGVAVKCEATIRFAAAATSQAANTTLPAASRFTKLDAKAYDWLQKDGAQAARLLIDNIEREQGITEDRLVLLKHLPSGAVAPPFPYSVSEHQVLQIAIVVDMHDLASAEVQFSSCEKPLLERLKGDFGAFAARAEGTEEEPDFRLMPLGSLFQCGPERLAYSVTVTTEGAKEKSNPAPAIVQVRPVYHLGATAVMGFDWTQKSTYAVKSEVITKTQDRFGNSLFVGGTWYPFGVDYGRMRWWNYIVNPIAAVSLDNPKENFFVGNAFTVTGGISVAVGMAFHHLDALDGVKEGDKFTGDGNVPTIKQWSKAGRGFFLGVAVDNNIFKALKSIGTPAAGAGKSK